MSGRGQSSNPATCWEKPAGADGVCNISKNCTVSDARKTTTKKCFYSFVFFPTAAHLGLTIPTGQDNCGKLLSCLRTIFFLAKIKIPLDVADRNAARQPGQS